MEKEAKILQCDSRSFVDYKNRIFQLIEEILRALKKKQDTLKAQFQKVDNLLGKTANKLTENTQAEIPKLENEILSVFDAARGELDSSTRASTQEIDDLVGQISSRAEKDYNAAKGLIETSLPTQYSKIDAILNETGITLSTRIDTSLSSVKPKVDRSFTDVQHDIETELEQTSASIIADFDGTLSILTQSLSDAANTTGAILLDVLEKLQKMHQDVQQFRENLINDLSALETRISADYTKSKKAIQVATKNLSQVSESKLIASHELMENEVLRLAGDLKTRLNQELNSTSSELETETKDIADSLLPKLESTKKSLQTESHRISRITTKELEKTKTSFNARGQQLTDTVKARLAEILNNLEDAITDFHKSTASSVEEADSEINKAFQSIQEKLTNIREQTTGFSERFKEIEDVYAVRGTENIRHFMRNAISRAKSNLYLIVPELDNEDIETLKRLSPHVAARLVVFGGYIPEELTGQDTLTIRQASEGAPFYGLSRDREEIVFVPLDEPTPIATVSSIDGMVTWLSRNLEEVWTKARPI
ncbi:MAG: hypothetical protein ACE5R6_19420 [Candidatus Heimdallarchaeota archaeon]